MIERIIDLNMINDGIPVPDPDGKLHDTLKEKLLEVNEKFSNMLYLLKNGALTEDAKQSNIVFFEKKAVEILNELGCESLLNKEKKTYMERIVSLSEKNYELRKQLGMKVSNEDFRERFKLIYDAIGRWWEKEGTGNIEDITMDKYGINICLNGLILQRRNTEKNQADILAEKGFDVVSYIDDFGSHLSVTDKNLSLLNNLLKRSFPNADIKCINFRHYTEDSEGNLTEGHFLIDKIKIKSYNLDDIKIEDVNDPEENNK